ncbi:MAG: HNH endonuclease [Janthinobacterium lividum]
MPNLTNRRSAPQARKPIGKSQRFRILHRDGFQCTYCGATPPDVVLHIDHVKAVANGGSNDDENLVTACLPCNLGKGVAAISQSRTRVILSSSEVMNRPRVEFFWQYDDCAPRRMKAARCIEWCEDSLVYGGPEYNAYCRASGFSTHGHSTGGFSPYEAAMYAVEILSEEWASFSKYLAYIDDLNLMAAAGHLSQYIAPHVLRGLHPQTIHSRCGAKPSDYEDIADATAAQSHAAFADFISSQHAPWVDAR